MRKVIYTIHATNYSTTDYNLIKNLPQSAYSVHLEEIKPTETKEQKEKRLERMKRKLDAIALSRAVARV